MLPEGRTVTVLVLFPVVAALALLAGYLFNDLVKDWKTDARNDNPGSGGDTDKRAPRNV